MSDIPPSYRERFGLKPVINAAGTMTALGASIIVPEAVAAMAAIAGEFVDIDELQRHAGSVIARHTGAESGFVTACSASGIAMSVAGVMTGADLAAVERLPDTARCGRNEVVILLGHMVNYGAPIEQLIRMTGAKVVPVGAATEAHAYQWTAALGPRTAAAVFVVSHHTVQSGMIPLATVVALCSAHGIPVIVDAASEHDFAGFVAAGADLVVFSGHKFLCGPTSGIVAGRKALVEAAYLQNRGIGRPMKAGKESIAGALAALQAWALRDQAAIRKRERAALRLWQDALARCKSLSARTVPDPTGNPIERLELTPTPGATITLEQLVGALAAGEPPIALRTDEISAGRIFLDPCNLHPGEADIVAERLRDASRCRVMER